MKEKTPRVDWAEWLKRTFDFDVFVCVRCGGRRRVPRGRCQRTRSDTSSPTNRLTPVLEAARLKSLARELDSRTDSLERRARELR
ncbi:hypothetical protein [Cystobacter fuscus]|uniref:hypothetical protein n=1 Tax=Cystobacter fuscus TaxID=43 RepID=UPI0037C1594E